MKKILAFIIVISLALSLVACGATNDENYTLSKDVERKSIVKGVMTEIDSEDPILEKSYASWLDTCVLYEVNVRQYTEEGTFKAFEGHLQRLKDMGINTLWFMPIHPISETERKGTLGSYYAVDDYMAVNPEFGTMEDFQHLVDTAHEMGFKVVLDWVANHTGWDNKWIDEHKDWYKLDDDGEVISPYDWTDVAQLDYDNYKMRAEMIKCMQYWVEEVGIDGFRCDHAIGVPANFWNAAVYKLKSINSEIMMLAETSATESLTSYAFDSCYNDILYGQAVSVKDGIAPSTVLDGVAIDPNYPEKSFPMNFLDNHDKNSYEGSIVERYQKTLEPLLALTYIAPGYPLIYTSNEQGYDHAIEFFEKDAVKWDENPKYAQFIKELSALRAENKALYSSNRDLEVLEVSNSHIVGFSRTNGDNKVIFLSNLYYDKVDDIEVELGFDKATCAIHYDGEKFDFEDKEITAKGFDKKVYNPYEFYIITVDAQ